MRKKDLKFAIVAVDSVTLGFVAGELSVLLIEPNNKDYQGKYALIGGLVLPTETAEDAVLRHLKEKGGLAPDHVEQLHTFSALDRDTRGRVISVAYLSLLRPSKVERKSENAIWLPVKKAHPLAYDHDEILRFAKRYLKSQILQTDIIKYLMPKEFTLTDLQKAYEKILNKKLDKRNFRKKILSLGWVESTGNMEVGAHRPAALYRFTNKKQSTW